MNGSFTLGALAVRASEANAVGAVRLTLLAEKLEIELLRVGSFSEGYVPGALTRLVRFAVPYRAVRGLTRKQGGLWLKLDPLLAAPFNSFFLVHFTDVPLELLAAMHKRWSRLRALNWLVPVPAAFALAYFVPSSLVSGSVGRISLFMLAAVVLTSGLSTLLRWLARGGPRSSRWSAAFEEELSRRMNPSERSLLSPLRISREFGDPTPAPAPVAQAPVALGPLSPPTARGPIDHASHSSSGSRSNTIVETPRPAELAPIVRKVSTPSVPLRAAFSPAGPVATPPTPPSAEPSLEQDFFAAGESEFGAHGPSESPLETERQTRELSSDPSDEEGEGRPHRLPEVVEASSPLPRTLVFVGVGALLFAAIVGAWMKVRTLPEGERTPPAVASSLPEIASVSSAEVLAPRAPTCSCERNDSPLWRNGLPVLSVIPTPKKIVPGTVGTIAPTVKRRRSVYDFDLVVVNNSAEPLRDVRVVVTFARRNAADERIGATDRGLFWEGPLGGGESIKWGVKGPGTELRIDVEEKRSIGPVPPASADAIMGLLKSPKPAVRLHAAMFLAYLGDPRAREVTQALSGLDAAQELVREEILRATSPHRVCAVEYQASAVTLCAWNGSDERLFGGRVTEVGGARVVEVGEAIPAKTGLRIARPDFGEPASELALAFGDDAGRAPRPAPEPAAPVEGALP